MVKARHLPAALVALVLMPAVQARMISIALHNGKTTANAMTADLVAGVVPAGHWNNVDTNNRQVYEVTTPIALVDDQGIATGAGFTYKIGYSNYNSNGWSAGRGDYIMMEGWFGMRASDNGHYTITNIPFARYDVYVYYESNNHDRTVQYILGSQVKYGKEGPLFDGTFTKADGTSYANATAGNYLLFESITDRTLIITADAVGGRAACQGIQIVESGPRAFDPQPANGQYQVPTSTVLSWQTGPDPQITGHFIYLGTDRQAVSVADSEDATGIYRGYQPEDQHTYDPAASPMLLVPGATYYWRIDERLGNDLEVVAGDIWSFTTAVPERAAVSISFDMASTALLAPDDIAGVVPCAHWNNYTDVDQPNTRTGLVDAAGNVTTAAITVVNMGYWGDNGYDAPGHFRMMNNWAGMKPEDTAAITMTGLPAELTEKGYDVYVYFQSNDGDRIMAFTIGSETIHGGEQPGFDGVFIEAHGTSFADSTVGNYVVFRGLTGSGFTLTGQTDTTYRAAFNGIQIAAVQPVAADPFPADGARQVATDVTLTWTSRYADDFLPKYNVYFADNPGVLELKSELQSQASFTPLGLQEAATYYWRIDVVDESRTPAVIYPGPVWRFNSYRQPGLVLEWRLDGNSRLTPRLYDGLLYQSAIKSENIYAQASSEAAGRAINTVNGSGLSADFLHDTDPDMMWCTGPTASAWVHYTFDRVYDLGRMWIWNYNAAAHTDRGLRDIAVEYSTDGLTWTTLGGPGNLYTIAQAPATDNYAYAAQIDFNGAAAKHVLLRAGPQASQGNYGANEFGLAEVRFGLTGTTEADLYTADTSGNGAEGRLVNHPAATGPLWKPGLVGGCLEFTGRGDAVENADVAGLPLGGDDAWTMNLYIHIDDHSGKWTRIASFGDEGRRQLILTMSGSLGFVAEGRCLLESNTPLSAGRWHTATVARDADALRLYQDGVCVASVALPLDADADLGTNAGVVSYAHADNFRGRMDEFTLWDQALGLEDIARLAAKLVRPGDYNSDKQIDFEDVAELADAYPADASTLFARQVLDDFGDYTDSSDPVFSARWASRPATHGRNLLSLTDDPESSGNTVAAWDYDSLSGRKAGIVCTLTESVDLGGYDQLCLRLYRHAGAVGGSLACTFLYQPGPDPHQRWEVGQISLPGGVDALPPDTWTDWILDLAATHVVNADGLRIPYDRIDKLVALAFDVNDPAQATGTLLLDDIVLISTRARCYADDAPGVDTNGDCRADMADFAVIARNWLEADQKP